MNLLPFRRSHDGIAVQLSGVGSGVKERMKREHSRRYFSVRRGGPQVRLPIGAAPGERLGLRACWMLILGAGILCLTAMGAAAPGAKPGSAPQAKDAAPGDNVGAETCATCHQEVAKGF